MTKALATRVSQEEKLQMWEMSFAKGLSMRKIAEELGRDLTTVHKHLNTEDAKEFEKKLHAEMGRRAKGALARGAERAAKSWLKQLDLADRGERANHQPAKDLLTHVGAIDIAVPNVDRGTQIIIQIGKGVPQDIEAEVIEGEVVG